MCLPEGGLIWKFPIVRENCFGHKQLEVKKLELFFILFWHGKARMKTDKAEKYLKCKKNPEKNQTHTRLEIIFFS